MQATEKDALDSPAMSYVLKATGTVKIVDVTPPKIVSQHRIRAIMLTVAFLILIAGAVLYRYL